MGNMMRTPKAVIAALAILSKKYGVDRKVLLNASTVILKYIMEKGATSITVVGSDGETTSIPVPFIFDKEQE